MAFHRSRPHVWLPLLAFLLNGCSTSPKGTEVAPWLFETQSLQAGDVCALGGVTVKVGQDNGADGGTPGDGKLQDGEVTQEQHICALASTPDLAADAASGAPSASVATEKGDPGDTGAMGATGATGSPGANGAPGEAATPIVVEQRLLAPGYQCENGGLLIVVGHDGGANGGGALDGVLQPGEEESRKALCSATRGPLSATGLELAPAASSCAPRGTSQTEGVRFESAFPTLAFEHPTAMTQPPGDASRWFLLEQAGRVMTFSASRNAAATTALDLRGRVHAGYEPGLLGIAFHPRWPARREIFLYYTTKQGLAPGMNFRNVLSRFKFVEGDDTAIDPASEQELLSVQRVMGEHNGGDVHFGPDGYLYVAIGEPNGWPTGEAQDLQDLNGKFLRIDIDNTDSVTGKPYGIPRDNPYANGGGAPEIWATGFRNPWRWSFDSKQGTLWAADVGMLSFEEIDKVEAGKNYGWPLMEGAHCLKGERVVDDSCKQTSFTPPVAEYKHADGCSITGGFVYRGAQLSGLTGLFLYADFCLGTVWGLDTANPSARPRWLANSEVNVSAFAQAQDGELFLLDWYSGKVLALLPQSSESQPQHLTDTGCVDPQDPTHAATSAIPYSVNAPLYSDGAYKERFLFLPDGGKLFVADNGKLVVPSGTVLMKTFRVGDRLVETRLMTHHADGGWSGWSYEWNEDQTDAVLLDNGKTVELSGDSWSFPDRGDCLHCHTKPTERTLGLEVAQLNRVSYYPSTGRWANQLTTLEHIGVLQNPLPKVPSLLPKLAALDDTARPVSERARAFLHSNCSHCHQPGGGGYGEADYRYATGLARMNVCNKPTVTTDFGIGGAVLLAPGNPDRSLIVQRLSLTDSYAMHPYRETVDTLGVSVVREWVTSLSDCNQ